MVMVFSSISFICFLCLITIVMSDLVLLLLLKYRWNTQRSPCFLEDGFMIASLNTMKFWVDNVIFASLAELVIPYNGIKCYCLEEWYLRTSRVRRLDKISTRTVYMQQKSFWSTYYCHYHRNLFYLYFFDTVVLSTKGSPNVFQDGWHVWMPIFLIFAQPICSF